MTAYVAPEIGDHEAVEQLARWSREPSDVNGLKRGPPQVDAEYRGCAMVHGRRVGWVVWGISLLLGLGVGLLMGRGGLYIGQPTIDHGSVGFAFFLVKLLLIVIVLGIGRLLARVAGRVVGVSYSGAAAGIIVGAVIAIPVTVILKFAMPEPGLEAILVPIARHISLLCGTMTLAGVAAVLAPTIIPPTRGAEADIAGAD